MRLRPEGRGQRKGMVISMEKVKKREKKPPQMTTEELERALDRFGIGMPFSSSTWHEYVARWERSEQRKQRWIERWQAFKAVFAGGKPGGR